MYEHCEENIQSGIKEKWREKTYKRPNKSNFEELPGLKTFQMFGVLEMGHTQR